MNSNISASVAMIKVGRLNVEGMKSELKEYGIAVPQFCDFVQFDKAQASRSFKALLKEDPGFDFDKWKTELNPKAVNIIKLDQIEKLLFRLSLKGHKPAINISESLIGLSLRQLFADAFEETLTATDRQDFLAEWQEVRELARIAHSAFDNAVKRNKYVGNHVHDLMTMIIFGDTAKMARAKALVHGELDPRIGLNHQDDIRKMGILYRSKIKFANLRKGTWQEKVRRAVKLCCN